MPRIAVTGASGFVGSRLVSRLLAAGHEVRALVRLEAPSWGGSVAVVRGDVRNPHAIGDLAEGCDVLVHLAASFDPADDVSGVIVDGTRQVVSAAQAAGVQRVVLVSCMGADASDDSPLYAAKWEAEMLVRASGLPFVILRPSLILGPGDGVLKPLGGLIRALPVIPIPGRGEQRMQPVDVDDVVRCLLDAIQRDDLRDETLEVGGPMFLTFRQLVDLVSGQVGSLKPKLLLPPDWLASLAGVVPPARQLYSPARLAQFGRGVVASPGAVDSAFGFAPVSVLDRMESYLA